MSKSKSLGSVAEGAFLSKWWTLPDDTKVADGRSICFQAAAEAVAKAAGEQVFDYALDVARSPRGDAERAVIEAAREAKRLLDASTPLDSSKRITAVERFYAAVDALEALQEARDE